MSRGVMCSSCASRWRVRVTHALHHLMSCPHITSSLRDEQIALRRTRDDALTAHATVLASPTAMQAAITAVTNFISPPAAVTGRQMADREIPLLAVGGDGR